MSELEFEQGFSLDPESISRAVKLSSRMIQDLSEASEKNQPNKIREKFSAGRYADEAEDVPVNDVVANVGHMAMEIAMARRFNNKIPCLKMDEGELALISMTQFFGAPFGVQYGSEILFEFWEMFSQFHPRFWEDIRSEKLKEEEVIATAFDNAKEGINRSLTAFLSYRFAGMKMWNKWIRGAGIPPSTPPPAVGPGGNLQVQVTCLTPGLRLHISPAYFINWVFFGSPTTPVSSYVLPGRYIFGADGPSQPILIKDPALFSIPPTYHPALMSF